MKLISNFNERFKEAFQGRSVTDFALEVGVSKQAISAYLNGSRKPKKIVAEIIAQHLNVSPAWLLGYDVPKEPPVLVDVVTPESDSDDSVNEFIELFKKLTPEEQKMLIHQINGIISNRE